MKDIIFHTLTILANIGMILFGFFIFTTSYGSDRYLVLLLVLPALLSLYTLYMQGDREERRLRKALRKAELRQRLKELETYTS